MSSVEQRGNELADSLAMAPILLSAKAAAKLCGLSLSTWWSMDSAGEIPRKLRCGKRCLWRRHDLELWAAWDLPSREVFEQRKAAIEGSPAAGSGVRLVEGRT